MICVDYSHEKFLVCVLKVNSKSVLLALPANKWLMDKHSSLLQYSVDDSLKQILSNSKGGLLSLPANKLMTLTNNLACLDTL